MSQNRIRKIFLWLGLIMLAFSLAALFYALQPNPIELNQILLDPTLLAPPGKLP